MKTMQQASGGWVANVDKAMGRLIKRHVEQMRLPVSP